jgi:hypothetical protein
MIINILLTIDLTPFPREGGRGIGCKIKLCEA